MTIFETSRLSIRRIENADYDYFNELLTHPEILKPVPQEPFSEEEVKGRFEDALKQDALALSRPRSFYGVSELGKSELIGLCLFLTNDEDDREIGYRFRVPFWRKGYGTELAKGMIDYCFDNNVPKVTADANTENIGSIKILERLLTPVRDFFNERDNCTDRRFELINPKAV